MLLNLPSGGKADSKALALRLQQWSLTLKESPFNLIGVRLWTWFQPSCWGFIRKSFWNALEASGGRCWQYFYRTIYLWAPPDPSNLTYYILYYIMYLTLCKPFIVKFSLNSEISRPVFFNINCIYSNLYLTFNLQEKNYAEKTSPNWSMRTRWNSIKVTQLDACHSMRILLLISAYYLVLW